MKNKIYGILLVIIFYVSPYSSFSQTDSLQEKIDGYCDHIIVTIPGIHFDSLVQVLKMTVPHSMIIFPDNSKAFLMPKKTNPYVEFWNSSTNLYTGSQIGLGSKEEKAIAKAQSHYGYDGVAEGNLLTVGREYSVGHPYGGNFFVSYGKMDISNNNDSIEVNCLKEIRTLLPDIKTFVKDDYSFFSLEVEDKKTAFTATDVNGTVIRTKLVKSTPEALLEGGIGHVSLRFELVEELYAERKEINIGDSMKFIFDKKSFTLILLTAQYDKW